MNATFSPKNMLLLIIYIVTFRKTCLSYSKANKSVTWNVYFNLSPSLFKMKQANSINIQIERGFLCLNIFCKSRKFIN